jgi:pyruvate formate lyase activating enzyme
LTLSHLEPVLETLIWLAKNRAVWLEITNLIIPRENDDPALIRSMCEWISAELGVDVPLHFSRFFPDFKLTDHPITEHRTLIDAYDIAAQAGLRYVYLGNVYDPKRQTTRCPSCRRAVIERGGRETYSIDRYGLEGGRCIFCGGRVAGVFGAAPSAGAWPERPHLVQLTGGRADG